MARTSGQPVNLLIAAASPLTSEHRCRITGVRRWPLTIGAP
jgi:hypothetical protein